MTLACTVGVTSRLSWTLAPASMTATRVKSAEFTPKPPDFWRTYWFAKNSQADAEFAKVFEALYMNTNVHVALP